MIAAHCKAKSPLKIHLAIIIKYHLSTIPLESLLNSPIFICTIFVKKMSQDWYE